MKLDITLCITPDMLRTAQGNENRALAGHLGTHFDVMDKVSVMTDGRVNVGSGTLYNLLEQFQEAGMIRLTKAEGRRRSYVLTEKGRQMLAEEYTRLKQQMADYCAIFGKEDAR